MDRGGVRVNAFAFGGWIPDSRKGTVSTQLIHISDIYASFIRLAHYGTSNDISGDDLSKLVHDADAEAANLPPVDSLDTLWDAISGSSNPKRKEIHLSTQALLSGRYKLVVGVQPMNMWQGPVYPNATGSQPMFPDIDSKHNFDYDCGPSGCLFDVFADPTEQVDLALQLPETRKELLDRLAELNKSEFKPDRGSPSLSACIVAKLKYNGFYGPFIGVSKGLHGDQEESTVAEK
jgi:arylsulfatase B